MQKSENNKTKEKTFLTLTRSIGERIFVGDDIEIVLTDVDCKRGNARISIAAPPDVRILRDDAKKLTKS